MGIFKKQQNNMCKWVIPRKVQDIIPVMRIYDDGMFEIEKGKFSKTYKFTDINFAVASEDDKKSMLEKYYGILNSFDHNAITKITINNRRIDKDDFKQTLYIPENNDDLDIYRDDYNKVVFNMALRSNTTIQEKYITISINQKTEEDARRYFQRVGVDLNQQFSRLGSRCEELTLEERLKICYDFYNAGTVNKFLFDKKDLMRKGHSFKDVICPDSYTNCDDYFKIGGRFGRVLFIKEFGSTCDTGLISDLTDLDRDIILSVDAEVVETAKAVKQVQEILLGTETNITNWQRKQNDANNWSATVPFELEQERNEVKEFLKDLMTQDERMFITRTMIVHMADTKEQLDSDTEAIQTIGSRQLCSIEILRYQQLDGLKTVMPFGGKHVDINRTMQTTALACLTPFRVQDVFHKDGVFYGQNVVSRNIIVVDKKKLQNGNSFILGVSGSGKSFLCKEELALLALRDKNADIIAIDPERELLPLIQALNGEIINVSSTSGTHINALDINKDYTEKDGQNPVILKSEFIMSLCEQLMGDVALGATQKSIIDRCAINVYKDYQANNYKGEPPTLREFRQELLNQNDPIADEIALAMELFTEGSLNTFAHQSNVNTDNRIICYDILDLGEQLRPIGMLTIFDSIFNRISKNRALGRNTYIFIDEFYLFLQSELTANFFFKLWKRIRKYGGFITGITQNISDLLNNELAETMLSNSELVVMLNQSAPDRKRLAELFHISNDQLSYISDVDYGKGLIKVGSEFVPFINRFPKESILYKLMTTKLEEVTER